MKLFLLFLMIALITSLSACSDSSATGTQHNTNNSVVCFSPALTEITFAVGAGNIVTGVSSFCNRPPEARTRISVGGVMNPNFEVLRTLNPSHVFLQGEMPKVKQFCTQYDISYSSFTIETFSDITNTIRRIGSYTENQSQAEIVCIKTVESWETIRKNRISPPVSAFICLWREDGPVAAASTISADSFLADALECAGGSNICADVSGAYPTVSREILTHRQPRVIFDMRPDSFLSPRHHQKIVNEWNDIFNNDDAVKIVVLTNDFILIPGPSITRIAELFSDALSTHNK